MSGKFEQMAVNNSILMDNIMALQNGFLDSRSTKTRKSLGQFFTGLNVSNYMAS